MKQYREAAQQIPWAGPLNIIGCNKFPDRGLGEYTTHAK